MSCHVLTCPCCLLSSLLRLFWSCACVWSEQQLSTTTIKDEKYEEKKEIFETRNEEKAFSTEVDALAFMTSLLYAYTNEEMKGKDDKNDDIG